MFYFKVLQDSVSIKTRTQLLNTLKQPRTQFILKSFIRTQFVCSLKILSINRNLFVIVVKIN